MTRDGFRVFLVTFFGPGVVERSGRMALAVLTNISPATIHHWWYHGGRPQAALAQRLVRAIGTARFPSRLIPAHCTRCGQLQTSRYKWCSHCRAKQREANARFQESMREEGEQ